MIAFFLLSGTITPAFAFLLLYFNITDQYRGNADGELIMVETKAEAQKDVAKQLVRRPLFWAWATYTLTILSIYCYGMFL